MALIGAEWHYALLILFIWFSGCTTQEKYDVYPMCPANEDCLTLSTVVNEKDTYFTSNVTLVFHPGDHSLQDEIVSVADVSNLTLQGSTASSSSDALATRILCDNSFFSYSSVPFLRIHSINFVSCRSVLSFTVALFQDCSFKNSTGINGGAMYVDSASNVMFVGQTVFTGNTAIQTGGAIYTSDSAITFSGETTFAVNHAQSGSGGAVYAEEDNTLSFSGYSMFEENTAIYYIGGALSANENNTLSFSGNCSFKQNAAGLYGGALYANAENTLNFSGSSSFEGNTAEYYGGVLCANDNNILSFIGSSSFEGNTAGFGGALYADENNILSFSGSNSFEGNTAEYYGGALYANNNNYISFSGNKIFDRNGGAMAAHEKHTSSVTGNSSFMGNTADIGGALHANAENTLNFSGHSNFEGNTAEYFGGALCADENNILSFSGSSSFEGNRVDKGGGALYATENNTLTFSGDIGFDNNTALSGGAFATKINNTLSFSGNSRFEGNTAETNGGALFAGECNVLSFNGTSNFVGNTAYWHGGALCVSIENTLSFHGYSNFEGNAADISGGAVYTLKENSLHFSEYSTFKGNTAINIDGGGLSAMVENCLTFNGKNSFEGNTANTTGGALSIFKENTLSFSGSSSFDGNTVNLGGGALYAFKDNIVNFSGSSSFDRNTAGSGGALYAARKSVISFSGTNDFRENIAITGGVLYCVRDETIFSGKTLFLSNTARILGGVIYAVNSVTQLTGNFTFAENKANDGGGICLQGGRITFQGEGTYIDNTASQGGYGGAILAFSSVVAFNGSYQFTTNSAGFGGGMALAGDKDRTLVLEPGTNMSFNGNAAHKRGGALYVEDNPFTYCIFNTTTVTGLESSCFMQFFDPKERPCDTAGIPLLESTTGIYDYVNLTFLNNTATESGSDLYGGDLDSCGICVLDGAYFPVQGSAIFEQITTVNASSKLEISSDPYRVCICMNNHTQCNQTTINIQKYPGETLSVSLVSVGLMDGPVPSVIRAVSENLTRASTFKVTQPAENNQFCTELQYPLFSEETNETLTLYSDEPCSTSGFPLTVHITFLPCPVAFTLSDQGNCICEERLQKYTQNCVIEKLSIKREQGDSFWVGLENASKSGLILHPHCPFDYCTEEAVNFTIYNTDLQCSSGRSGVLCGGCQSGHSLALGSSQCLSGCSNSSLALLLAFAAAGVVLVAFLFLCRLTVAEGTLSGLIFYANVLAVNRSIFFPAGTTNILTVFIAWLNLDLGIETCFFEGLDAYSRTWLQFVFPIYIWVLVGIVIYLADVTTTFARIIGRTNPVAVLTTLFLLSYTKLLRTILAAFSFTTLDYPGDESRLVWLYDGNIGYLDKHDGKHIILFIISLLVFLFAFLPYTLLLLCGQWILRKLQLRWLSSTKQLYLKAFLDAYYAPFNDKHCYWTGLLLLLRSFIVLLSTLMNIKNPQDPFVSLAVLQGIVSGMLLWAWFTESLYKKWYLNILEASFIFNLVVLIGGTYQIRLSGGNQDALAYTSVAIAFATFIGLVIVGVTRQGKNVIQRRRTVVQQRRGAVLQLVVNTEGNDSKEAAQSPVVAPPSNVPCSVVEIFRHGSQEDIEMEPLVTVPEGNN